MDLIRDCAESVASHWQQLMLKMEDRLKLVNASVAFYKTSEQVRDPHGGFSIQFDYFFFSVFPRQQTKCVRPHRSAVCWRAWSRSIREKRTGAEELTNWDRTVKRTM